MRFPGQYFDKETNLAYNYFRDYEVWTGRYVQSDPIGLAGGLNTYGYASSSPLRRTDPTGEASLVAGVGLAGAIIIGSYIYSQQVTPSAGRKPEDFDIGEVPTSKIDYPANSCPFFPDDCAKRKAQLEGERDQILRQLARAPGLKLGRLIEQFNDKVDGHNTFCSSHPVDRI